MRKEVENVISGGRKESIISSSDFKKFLMNWGLKEKVYAPRKFTGVSHIDSKKVTFNVNGDDKVGNTKVISLNGINQTLVIEEICVDETDISEYPNVNYNSFDENYKFHYKEELMPLTEEEISALYDYYMSSQFEEKPIVIALNIIGIVICIIGFILGIVVGNADMYDFNYVYMISVWIAAFIQAILFFALASIIQLLNKIQWQQPRK